jgi:hypothetical protein
MFKRTRTAVSACAALMLVSAFPIHGNAQENHAHTHSTAGVAQLQLNAGNKWTTDAPLRSGMAAVRNAFEADHPAIHAGKQTAAQYEALAARIDKEVQSIIANCKLPPDADANLHYIVADLMQGVALMRSGDTAESRHEGASLVHGALNAYPRYFDDPTWTPPEALH